MSDYQLDLTIPEFAYMFGFLQADGHLYANTRNRGKLTLELQAQDVWLLEQFVKLVPFYSSLKFRTRQTNFRDSHTSAVWSIHDRSFREALIARGFPVGKKSNILAIPDGEFSIVDYFRGIVDADGSLGLTAKGFPYVSLITASESLATEYIRFLYEKIECRKKTERNLRDRVFNIAVFKEDAQALVSCLYYPGGLALPRKVAKVPEIACWQRLSGRRKYTTRSWCVEEDDYILHHTVEESALFLGRTIQSIKMRLWRLKSKKVTD